MTAQRDLLLKRPFAHRGLHDLEKTRPENSRAAFRAAIEAGYGIELDVQMSKDGCPMVFHDYDLSRLTSGKGAIRRQTCAELQKTCLLGGTETIPTLAQVLKLVAGRAPILIEIKDQDGGLGPDTCGLETAVAADLEKYAGPAALMSFNPHSVGYLADAIPGVPRGLVTGPFSKEDFPTVKEATLNRLRDIPDFKATGATFISHNFEDLQNPWPMEFRKKGIPVLTWTIESPADEAIARRHCDNITFERYLPETPNQ